MRMIADLLDFLVPRFVTEWVAFVDEGDYYCPVCPVNDLVEGEAPDAVGIVQSFALFGFGLFPKYGYLYGPETAEYALVMASTDNL